MEDAPYIEARRARHITAPGHSEPSCRVTASQGSHDDGTACGETMRRDTEALAQKGIASERARGHQQATPRFASSDASPCSRSNYGLARSFQHSSCCILNHFTMSGWKEATAVQKSSSNSYTATLHDDWCIGSGELPMHAHSQFCCCCSLRIYSFVPPRP
jgi:hypothetical protein